MAKHPQVLGIILCERMEIDPGVGQLSLVGVLHALRFRQFPTPARKFTAYVALYGGEGEGTMELVCTRLETEEDTYSYRRWYAFPDPGMIVHLEIPIARCAFPAPGRYSWTLRFD